MDNQEKLKNYIYQQFQAGLHPDEITQQLRTAGWDETTISDAFRAVQSAITPSPQPLSSHTTTPQDLGQTATQGQQLTGTINNAVGPTTSNPATHFEPTGRKRGRIKTSWLLLKQSIKILQNNKQLFRYPFMGAIISLLIAIVFAIIIFANGDTFVYRATDVFGDEEFYFTGPGMVVGFIYYVIAFFVIFMYNAGLAAHVLDIFRGKSQDYKYYMKIAWSKRVTIFFYSLITATIGLILHAIEQRSRWIGYIVSRILGALWSLANLFTIPIIVESDSSAPSAIKQSTKLFLSRWGENIAARITFGGLALVIYLLVLVPFFALALILSTFLGTFGLILLIAMVIASIILFVTVETAASNVLSTALYFYARYQQIPAAYDPELLNSVFIPKKKRGGLFGKKDKQAPLAS